MFVPNTGSPQMALAVSQPCTPPSVSYGCSLLHQIQGSYIMETANGFDRIHVFSPISGSRNDSGTDQYCIVRWINSFDVTLQDQMIFEEPSIFVLYSSLQEATAYVNKAMDMRNGVSWTNVKTGFNVCWKRVGTGAINQISPMRTSQWCQGEFSPATSNSSYQAMVNYEASSSISNDSNPTADKRGRKQEKEHKEQDLFFMIKSLCSGRPNLVKKVVKWGLSADANFGTLFTISPAKIQELSRGRYWVTCMKGHSRGPRRDKLDDIKGAYQELVLGAGIYIQPQLEQHELGRQHRLREEGGKWVIEWRDPASASWKMRAKQQSGTRWLDMKEYSTIWLNLLPLKDILDRMVDESFNLELDRLVDFLYQNCNQKKLTTKLTKRNISHNITNLKTSLRKQHNLTFAVRVANKADEIAKEHGIYG